MLATLTRSAFLVVCLAVCVHAVRHPHTEEGAELATKIRAMKGNQILAWDMFRPLLAKGKDWLDMSICSLYEGAGSKLSSDDTSDKPDYFSFSAHNCRCGGVLGVCGSTQKALRFVFFKDITAVSQCKKAPTGPGCHVGKTFHELKDLLTKTKEPLYVELNLALGSKKVAGSLASFGLGHNLVIEKPAHDSGDTKQHVYLHSSYVGAKNGGFDLSDWEGDVSRVKLPMEHFLKKFDKYLTSKTVGQALKRYGALFFLPPGPKPRRVVKIKSAKTGKKWKYSPKYGFNTETLEHVGAHQNEEPDVPFDFLAMVYKPTELQENMASAVALYGKMLDGEFDQGRKDEHNKTPKDYLNHCLRSCWGVLFDEDQTCEQDGNSCTWESIHGGSPPAPFAVHCAKECKCTKTKKDSKH